MANYGYPVKIVLPVSKASYRTKVVELQRYTEIDRDRVDRPTYLKALLSY